MELNENLFHVILNNFLPDAKEIANKLAITIKNVNNVSLILCRSTSVISE